MKIYFYDTDFELRSINEYPNATQEYVDSLELATSIAPPEYDITSETVVFNKVGQNWIILPDFRLFDKMGRPKPGIHFWFKEDWNLKEGHVMTVPGPLPEGALLVRPEKPTPYESFMDEIKDMSVSEKKKYAYENLLYRFVNDDITQGFSDVPLCDDNGTARTVDESKTLWLNYFGDDDERATEYLVKATQGKAYIRSIFGN